MSDNLSNRGNAAMGSTSLIMQMADEVDLDPFHQIRNPTGYINLGLSENKLCSELLLPKLQEIGAFDFEPHCQYYPIPSHTTSFKENIASFLSSAFQSVNPVPSSTITTFNGADCALAALAHCIADQDEYIVTFGPYYYLAKQNFGIIPSVKVLTLRLPLKDGKFDLNADALDAFLSQAKDEGKKVRGIMLINPNNPTGDVYHQEQVLRVLHVCKRHAIHVLVDEIYGLSVHNDAVKFRSVLSYPELPDPARTHMIWGFSKDFSLSGLRLGVVCSSNEALCQALRECEHYFMVPPIIVNAASKLLLQKDWLLTEFSPCNRQRLRESYRVLKEGLENLGVLVHPADGGFFVFANFTDFYSRTVGGDYDEMRLFRELLDAGVYIAPGSNFECSQDGWFRLIFAHPPPYLREGLRRIGTAAQKGND